MRYLIFFLIFTSAVLLADEQKNLSGAQWLEKVTAAMKTMNYHGTVVFMKNDQIDTMKYRHTVENGVETESLTSLNSPLRELTRKSNEIKCLYKEAHKKIEALHPADRSFIVNLPVAPGRVEGQYLLAVGGKEMIAMRPAQIIVVLPKDELRYARKIWVDTESWLPLKAEVYGPEDHAIEQVLFTEFAVDAAETNTNTEAEPSFPAAENQSPAKQAQIFEQSSFRLNHWPAGFETVFFVRNTMQASKKTVDHLLISDGFSNISVYFEEKGEHSVEGLRSLGSVNSFSRVIGNLQVTVLGEVPARTVEMVANGVALRDN